ncbi:Enoyl-[acyl-carrier-protein] reductase [NADH] [hydrothermal vent metagenome]|uniref:Enoyl-[acyl-carrier-protein] reductase [NADH] n=1 Tax=hydrothermal vent metagenome TaxID=652676 RepID=A0A3B1BUR3_9ZZZZ
MGIMEGKKGLIVGVANERSIAWGIARAAAREGAELAFTYALDQLEKRVTPLAESVGSTFVHKMDVTDDAQMDEVFEKLKEHFGTIDFIVHGVAFSDKNELKGAFSNTSRENFLNTMDISAYSLTALSRRSAEMMPDGGSILTLSFYGAQKVITNYNVMGVAKAALEASVRYLAVDLGPKNIRVNAISAGAMKTLASAGISNFKEMLNRGLERAPLGRNVTLDEVGNAGLYMLSDLSTATTGEVFFVDGGYHVTGV